MLAPLLQTEIARGGEAVALNSNEFIAWNGRGWVYKIAGLPGGSGLEL
jgi:adenylate cyclase